MDHGCQYRRCLGERWRGVHNGRSLRWQRQNAHAQRNQYPFPRRFYGSALQQRAVEQIRLGLCDAGPRLDHPAFRSRQILTAGEIATDSAIAQIADIALDHGHDLVASASDAGQDAVLCHLLDASFGEEQQLGNRADRVSLRACRDLAHVDNFGRLAIAAAGMRIPWIRAVI